MFLVIKKSASLPPSPRLRQNHLTVSGKGSPRLVRVAVGKIVYFQ